MKKLMIIWAITACALAAFAKGEGVGNVKKGEGVGNGKREGVGNLISKPMFGGPVEYKTTSFIKVDDRLLIEQTPEHTKISNPSLVTDKKQVSSIHFELIKKTHPELASITTTQQLISYLKQTKQTWLDVKIGGAEGYYVQNKGAGFLKAEYYLLTENHDLIRIVIEAFQAGDGLILIAPIVRTMSEDVTPPVILEMKLQGGNKFRVGQSGRIMVRAIDELSGIRTYTNERQSVSFSREDGKSNSLLYTFGSVHAAGNDWYYVDFTVDAKMESGIYVFNGVALFDRADNMASAHYNSIRPAKFYIDQTEWPKKDPKPSLNLPLIRIEVTNDGPVEVQEPAEIGNLRVKTPTVRSGEEITLDVYVPNKITMGHRIETSEFYAGGYSLFLFPVKGQDKSVEQKHFSGLLSVSALGKNWFSIKLRTQFSMPPGEYMVGSLTLMEDFKESNALWVNMTNDGYTDGKTHKPSPIQLAQVTVLPDDRPDREPPVIKTMKTEGQFGQEGAALLLQMFDDGSGINKDDNFYGYFVKTNTDPHIAQKRFSVYSRKVVQMYDKDFMYGITSELPAESASGWYRLIQESKRDYLPEGEYVLDELQVNDTAKNFVTLKANADGTYHKMDGYKDLGHTGLPVIKVDFRR